MAPQDTGLLPIQFPPQLGTLPFNSCTYHPELADSPGFRAQSFRRLPSSHTLAAALGGRGFLISIPLLLPRVPAGPKSAHSIHMLGLFGDLPLT